MLLRAVWQLCVRCFNERKHPNHSTFASVLHSSLASPWDPLRCAWRWKLWSCLVFSFRLDSCTGHSCRWACFHFYLFKVRKNKKSQRSGTKNQRFCCCAVWYYLLVNVVVFSHEVCRFRITVCTSLTGKPLRRPFSMMVLFSASTFLVPQLRPDAVVHADCLHGLLRLPLGHLPVLLSAERRWHGRSGFCVHHGPT